MVTPVIVKGKQIIDGNIQQQIEDEISSIRLKGAKIENLPIRESVLASQQLPDQRKSITEQKIADVKAGYPPVSIVYIESRIKEAKQNIVRIALVKSKEQAMINEYSATISLCVFRDKELALYVDQPDYEAKKKDLLMRFPPYNVEAMNKQIQQSKEAVDRFDDVTAKEYLSIVELKQALNKCQERDIQLKKLGATPIG